MSGVVAVGPIVGWRVWFDELTGDLSLYDSSQHSPSDLPSDGMLTIRVYYERPINGAPYADILAGNNTYIFYDHPSGGLVVASNDDSVAENKPRYPGATFIRGLNTTRPLMDSAHEAAFAADAKP